MSTRTPPAAWPAKSLVVALTALTASACGTTESVIPDLPGSIVLTTETAGFLKDDSYELLVNGESRGTIGANEQMTIPDLDPATYEVDLGDVAANCLVQSVSVPLGSNEALNVTLSVICAYATPDTYTLRFSRERPNLETGDIVECPFSICPSGAEWDLYVYYSSTNDPHSVIRQNQADAGEIAHLPGVALADLAEEDFLGATFTTDLVGDSFDAGRVILVRTDQGFVYALGNPVEDTQAQTLTFDATLIDRP